MIKKKIVTSKFITLLLLCVMSLGVIACSDKKIEDNDVKAQEEELKKQEEEEAKKKAEEERIEKRKPYTEGLSKVYAAFDKSDNKKAIELCNDLIKQVDDPYEAYALRGYAKAMSGNFENAMKDIDKSLEIKPDYGRGRHYKAFTYKLFKKNDSALEWFNKAVEVEPYSWSYFGAACLYSVKNDSENAIKYLKKAVELEPKAIKDRAKTEEDFDNIKNTKEFKQLIYN